MKRDDLLGKLEAQGVPAGPINNLEQVFNDPQVIYRGMKLDLPSAAAKGGTIPGVRTPIVMDGWKAASERPRRASASTARKSCARSAKADPCQATAVGASASMSVTTSITTGRLAASARCNAGAMSLARSTRMPSAPMSSASRAKFIGL